MKHLSAMFCIRAMVLKWILAQSGVKFHRFSITFPDALRASPYPVTPQWSFSFQHRRARHNHCQNVRHGYARSRGGLEIEGAVLRFLAGPGRVNHLSIQEGLSGILIIPQAPRAVSCVAKQRARLLTWEPSLQYAKLGIFGINICQLSEMYPRKLLEK